MGSEPQIYCCISLLLSSTFIFFIPLLLLGSTFIFFTTITTTVSSTFICDTTSTDQHLKFYTPLILKCSSPAEQPFTVGAFVRSPVARSFAQSTENSISTQVKQQSIATLLGLKCATEDKLDLRALLWLQEFLPFHFPQATLGNWNCCLAF